ncbi:MAG: hypothetical protein J6M62_10325 [Selenomonadaceae bacterium]|nr:hypothetical protein [Selenomonadaceae bacterium]
MKSTKEIEADIRRAFEVERLLPFPRPNNGSCYLGRLMVIPDTERSLEDIMEDIKNSRLNITSDDLKLWDKVTDEWLPLLVGMQRIVVVKRCQGMGWKRLARYLNEKNHTERTFDRTTLWRIFKNGLKEIQRQI